jgi:hypothetical protein
MELKKGIVPFLLIMTVLFILMDFGDGEIAFEFVEYEELAEEIKSDFSKMGPEGTGLFRNKGYSYAFITTLPNEKVEIEFVGEAEDGIGNEVKYKVVKKEEHEQPKVIQGEYGDFALYVIRLDKVVDTPFGFNNSTNKKLIE